MISVIYHDSTLMLKIRQIYLEGYREGCNFIVKFPKNSQIRFCVGVYISLMANPSIKITSDVLVRSSRSIFVKLSIFINNVKIHLGGLSTM